MTIGLKLLTRVALFSALVYVFMWLTSSLPNVNLVLFIVFSAGFVWGAAAGALVGIIGMGLSTVFNPYGPAQFYVMLAQVFGAALSGVVGAGFRRLGWQEMGRTRLAAILIGAAAVCTALYFIPVNLVDAWLIGPFLPRLATGFLWSLLSLGSNILIFPLLFVVTRRLYSKECGVS